MTGDVPAPSAPSAGMLPWQTTCGPQLQVDTVVHLLMMEGMRAARPCNLRDVRLIGLEILNQDGHAERSADIPAGLPGGLGARRECWTLDRCGELVAYVVSFAPDPNGGTNLSATYSAERSAPEVPRALRSRGVPLGKLDRLDLAVAICDEAVARFGQALEPELRIAVATALVNKGDRLLLGLGQRDQANAVYDEVVARFGQASEPELLVPVAKALLAKGEQLWHVDREQAFAVLDEVVARFGEAPEPELRSKAAQALLGKGARLEWNDQYEQAAALYDEVVARFSEASEPELSRLVSLARTHTARVRAT